MKNQGSQPYTVKMGPRQNECKYLGIKKTFCGFCCENLNDLKDFIELKDLRPQGLGPIEITYVLF